MQILRTMGDVQNKGIVDGFEYAAAGGNQNKFTATMRTKAAEICGRELIAQGHYEFGFETGMTRWIDGWDTPLGA